MPGLQTKDAAVDQRPGSVSSVGALRQCAPAWTYEFKLRAGFRAVMWHGGQPIKMGDLGSIGRGPFHFLDPIREENSF